MICSDLYDPCRREQWRTCMDDGPPDINTSVLDNQYSREKELFKSLCDIEFPIANSKAAFSRLFFVSRVRRTRKLRWLLRCRQRIESWGKWRHGSGTRCALSNRHPCEAKSRSTRGTSTKLRISHYSVLAIVLYLAERNLTHFNFKILI